MLQGLNEVILLRTQLQPRRLTYSLPLMDDTLLFAG